MGDYDEPWMWRIEIPLYVSVALATLVFGWLMPST